MLTKIRALRRIAYHVWWSPTFYMMRFEVWREPKHPMHDITDIHRWGACATPLLRQWNALMWTAIAVEAVVIAVLII